MVLLSAMASDHLSAGPGNGHVLCHHGLHVPPASGAEVELCTGQGWWPLHHHLLTVQGCQVRTKEPGRPELRVEPLIKDTF